MNPDSVKNQPAFPKAGLDPWNQAVEAHTGMSMRDYFAAKAMQGICASGPGHHMTNDMIATEAYALADSMLRASQR